MAHKMISKADGGRGERVVCFSYPNVSKIRAIGAFAITFKVLGYDGDDGHRHPNKTVVVNSNPDDVKPGQAALGRPPWAPISSTARLEPIQGHDPGCYWLQLSEELLLFM